MYRCYKLSIDLCELEQISEDFIIKCKSIGTELKKQLKDSFEEQLNDATDEKGIISGEKLIDTWFPVENHDVFLSYSHNDEDIALIIAGFLKSAFGLTVFIDELFWGSADQLLKEIDNKYCKTDKGNYDYTKRNFTSAHVHAMLSTAIVKAINQSETIIFINTENSSYNIKAEAEAKRTLSPWIFEEIFFTSIIQQREWYEHRKENLNEMAYFQKSMQISYLLPDKHLIPIDCQDLYSWSKLWEERKEKHHSRYGDMFLGTNEKIRHPLNVLYEYTCGNKQEDLISL